MTKYTTLDELISQETTETQKKIKEMSDELILETGLAMLREKLALSQREMAEAIGVSQSAIAQLEQRGNDVKLSTLKRYVEKMGGELSLTVKMPSGYSQIFPI
ncbi:helix-turn-helix domain-containing protein [Avibacterium avium]|uniref:helix-turn-helix domain-containing protein n=1 Tax=Avibacterium avium TaxID=751 RepID=UPI003BF7BED1